MDLGKGAFLGSILVLLFSGACIGQYAQKRITIINDTMPIEKLFYSYTLTADTLGTAPLAEDTMRQLTEIPGGQQLIGNKVRIFL